ncbi:MAG: class I tRNA ligase family protein, partial [Actinomycetota bacterium]
WWFCDDYLELVKGRAYAIHGDDRAVSARAALRRALSILQRLFAPLIPFVSEEVWRWWQEGSVHRAAWPVGDDAIAGLSSTADEELLEAVSATIAGIRRAKTEAKVGQKAKVGLARISAPAGAIERIEAAWSDIADAGSVIARETVVADGEITVVATVEPA